MALGAAKAAGRLCDLNRALLDRSARSAVRYRSQLSHHAARNSANFTLRLSSGRFHDASTNEILGQIHTAKSPRKRNAFNGLMSGCGDRI
jgi:hypothetical protein